MISYTQHQLPNGITLIHHEDSQSPFVIVNILYNIGAKHENPERTGFAHLFEHLMFGGSKHAVNFDDELQIAGGSNNAFTNNDFTNYYDILPVENVETGLWLEADRMSYLNINHKSLEVQRKVVCEEFKEHYISQPYGDVWHILREMAYQKHAYRWPTIGKTLAHIEEATLAEVKDFYEKYYAPCNATLVLAGNITFSKAVTLAEKWLGHIEKYGIKPSTCEREPSQSQQVLKTVHADVPLDALYIAFKMPERLTKEFYIADVLSDILSNGASSRLYQRMVKDLKLFVSIDAYISGSHDTGLFVIEGKLSDDVNIQVAQEKIFEEIEKIKNAAIDDKELRKVKNKMLTYMQFSDTSLLNKAISLAYYASLGDTARINDEEAHFEAVTAADIIDFVTDFLSPSQATILQYLKNRS